MVHIYNQILLSHEKDGNNAILGNMNGPRDCHTNWSKSEKEKYHLHVESKKNDTTELIYKTESHRIRKQTMGTKGG